MTGKPVVEKSEIIAALRAAGLAEGDTALAHSSLSSFGHVDGGADAVIDALLEAVGPGGTVLVPTHTWETVTRENPVFDVRETPSCVGFVTNVFRKRPGAVRGLHPTHSCAGIGPAAADLSSGHEIDVTPCGPHSPYARIMEFGGRIVFLGTGLSCNTTLHAIEEFACVPYLFAGFDDLYSVDYEGKRIHVPSRRHSWGFPRRFADLAPVMEENGIYGKGRAGGALIEVVDAVGMKRLFAPLVAKDQCYLLQDDAAKLAREWYDNRPQVKRLSR
ncbi:MAG: AAC(3) family N-acetyltransferase [Planctomycetota bacterium]|jgi:aminoglycoside 3-N-acetyltransferase